MADIVPFFETSGTVVTWLLGTLVALNLVCVTVGILLLRHFSRLRHLHGQYEQLNTGVTLLTEATESGFRWTTAELQRLTSIVRRSQSPQDVQQQLEQAVTVGKTARQIATEQGLPESEVQLRMRLAQARSHGAASTEVHVGAV